MATFFKTGSASDLDHAEAGRKAVAAALKQLPFGARPGLCLIFGSAPYDLKNVLKGVRSLIPLDTQVIGGTCESPSSERGESERALWVSLVLSDEFAFQVKASAWIKQEALGAVRLLKTEFEPFLAASGVDSFLTVIDGSTDGRAITVAALQNFKSDMHLAGGEGYPFSQGSGVIANDLVLSNAVAICAVKGPRPFFSDTVRNHKPIRGPLSSPKRETHPLRSLATAA
jgi:hypothetical protein